MLVLFHLRNLTTNRYPPKKRGFTYSLLDIIIIEYFSQGLSETEERVVKEKLDRSQVLWILDGYDEIILNVPAHLEYLFFEQLLKTPHHILTSRPYLNTLSYNVQMEITGFTDDNIIEYIEQFFDQMEDELDDAAVNSQSLKDFLSSNPSIWGVAHIPINLEPICSFWSNEDWSKTEQEITITKLYFMMMEWLCRRYLTLQGICIQHLSASDVLKHCQKELAFLQSLAFNAMLSNTVILKPILLKKARNEAQMTFQDHPHILNIGILKTFSKKGTGTQIEVNKDHYFVHLSFQEYFAALYLVDALQRSSNQQAIEFIKREKYNQRYTLVFAFAAGLLSVDDPNSCSAIFWDTLVSEPLDLVGIRHIQLLLSCFEETYDKSVIPHSNELLEWIANCIMFSFFMETKIIRDHLAQSLRRAQSTLRSETIMNVLINMFQQNDMFTRIEILIFIDMKLSNPSNTLINLLTMALQDSTEIVRLYACKALENMGGKAVTDGIINMLDITLEHFSSDVRRSACIAFGMMARKAIANEVISKLINGLKDERSDVRHGACKAIGRIGKIVATNEVITTLLNVLDDKNANLRLQACNILGMIAKKAATNEVISKLIKTMEDEVSTVHWSASLALKKITEGAVSNEIISKLVITLGDSNDNTRKNVCLVLGNIGERVMTDEVVDILVNMLNDKSSDVRSNACIALRNIGDKAAINEGICRLVDLLEDEEHDVQYNACAALENIGAKIITNQIIVKLLSTLDNKNDSIRKNACIVLGNSGKRAATDEMINKLVKTLDDASGSVRSSACKALGSLSGKVAINGGVYKLINALGDTNSAVRYNACIALGKIGQRAVTDEMISGLLNALQHTSNNVRLSACAVLGSICMKGVTNELISKLVEALDDENSDVRCNACIALGKMGRTITTNDVISKLCKILGDENKDIRWNACMSLGIIVKGTSGTHDLIYKLVDSLRDTNKDVPLNARIALEKIAANEIVNALENVLSDGNDDIKGEVCIILGNIGELAITKKIVSELTNALKNRQSDVRLNACIALGNMGKKVVTNTVITQLINTISEDQFSISNAASNTIEKLLSSHDSLEQLNPQLITDLCMCKHSFNILKNISMNRLIKMSFDTGDLDLLSAITLLALQRGVAVTITEEKVVIYDRNEPLELPIPSLEMHAVLLKAFTDRAKQLCLFFPILQQTRNPI